MKLADDYDRLISTILIGNNIVNITASTVGTVLFTKLYAAYGPTISTVVLTLVVADLRRDLPQEPGQGARGGLCHVLRPHNSRVFLLILRR